MYVIASTHRTEGGGGGRGAGGIGIGDAATCSSSPLEDEHLNMTLSMLHAHQDYVNLLLQVCSHRNTAQELWRFLLLLYGLASVFVFIKNVRVYFYQYTEQKNYLCILKMNFTL